MRQLTSAWGHTVPPRPRSSHSIRPSLPPPPRPHSVEPTLSHVVGEALPTHGLAIRVATNLSAARASLAHGLPIARGRLGAAARACTSAPWRMRLHKIAHDTRTAGQSGGSDLPSSVGAARPHAELAPLHVVSGGSGGLARERARVRSAQPRRTVSTGGRACRGTAQRAVRVGLHIHIYVGTGAGICKCVDVEASASTSTYPHLSA